MIVQTAARIGRVQEYYFSAKLRQIREMNREGLPVLNLGIGSPDMAPDGEVLEVLQRESGLGGNHAYQSYVGIEDLREAFAKWYARYFGVSLDAEGEILPLLGSKEGLMHLAMSFLEEGDEALVPNPAYPTYEAVTRLAGAEPVFYELGEKGAWLPDLEALAQRDLSRVKIMWLNYPHMPTGACATPSFFEELTAFAERHEILLVNDNPYAFVLNEPLSLLSVPGAKAVAVELNSLSKSHNMAGWRIGMLAGAKPYVQAVLKFKSNMDSGMFKPLQLAAARALALGDEWYQKQNEEYAARRKKVYELLDLLGCVYDEKCGGLFVWAKVPDGCESGYALSDVLLEETRVFITPGGIFGSAGHGYVRVSLCNVEEVFEEAIKRIKNKVLTPVKGGVLAVR